MKNFYLTMLTITLAQVLCFDLFPCSVVIIPPVEIEPTWVVVRGTVVWHITEDLKPLFPEPVPGFYLQLDERLIYNEKGDLVQVFPFACGTDCEDYPRELADIREQYPLGSKVAIVGKYLLFQDGNAAGEVRIGCSSVGFGGAARIPKHTPQFSSGFLDFAAYSLSYENQLKEFSIEVAWRNAHRSWFEDYEYIRCLLALRGNINSSAIFHILENMGNYHAFASECEYSDLLDHTGVSEADGKRLFDIFQKRHIISDLTRTRVPSF
jgi:hypothetical protein